MNFPANLKYTNDHEWVKVEGDIATIGITEFAQSELGDIVFVEIETVGQTLNAHEIFGTVEAVKTVSDLFLPLGGEIIEKNEPNFVPELEQENAIINSDKKTEPVQISFDEFKFWAKIFMKFGCFPKNAILRDNNETN